jgi:hypothetical protein
MATDEFLREETRKQRRNLDIVAVVAGLVVFLNLVPNRISVVGIDFGHTRKHTFLILLLASTSGSLWSSRSTQQATLPVRLRCC